VAMSAGLSPPALERGRPLAFARRALLTHQPVTVDDSGENTDFFSDLFSFSFSSPGFSYSSTPPASSVTAQAARSPADTAAAAAAATATLDYSPGFEARMEAASRACKL